MAETPMPKHGDICWHEINVPNAKQAQDFYQKLFGWTTRPVDMGGFTYHILKSGEREFGGIMQMSGPEWQGVPPHWMVYVAVNDVDAAAKKVSDLGGKVCVPPTDIPNVGRFAVVSDPGGATFSLYKSKSE